MDPNEVSDGKAEAPRRQKLTEEDDARAAGGRIPHFAESVSASSAAYSRQRSPLFLVRPHADLNLFGLLAGWDFEQIGMLIREKSAACVLGRDAGEESAIA